MVVPDGQVVSLAAGLRVGPGEMVGFVGAGGKTTTLLRLLTELRALGRGVLTTSTVHMLELKKAPPHPFVVEPDARRLKEILPVLLADSGHVRVAGERLRADKIRGLDAQTVDALMDLPGVGNLLVECDGARHRSLKAPAAHEPAIPARLDLLLIVAGLDVIGKPLTGEYVHRPEQVQALTGLGPGETISAAAAAGVLVSPEGGLKARPPAARAWVIATKLTPETMAAGEALATEVLSLAGDRIEGVLLLGPPPEDGQSGGMIITHRSSGGES